MDVQNTINTLLDLHCDSYSSLSCNECDKQYKTKGKLTLHIRNHHARKDLVKVSSEKLIKKNELKKLKNNYKEPKKKKPQVQSECPVCKKNFQNKNKLIQHLLCHIVIKTQGSEIVTDFKEIPSAYPQEEVMADIKRDFHMDVKLSCNSCNAEFEKKKEMIQHLKLEHSELFRRKRTNSRSKRIRRKNALEDYEEILVDDGRKESVENFKRFKEISECPLCKTPFSMKKNLLKHMKLIHRIDDFEISLEDRKPKIGHQCSECDKVFSLRKNLFQHLRKIHGKTDIGRKAANSSETVRLICDACGVGFGEKKSLMRHLRFKHAIKFYKEKKTVAICVHCNSTFAHRKSLYKHERKFHGAQYKKVINIPAKSDTKKTKDRSEKPGNIGDHECLQEILPQRDDYKLTQFTWVKRENSLDSSENWFKAKLHFYCENKEEIKKWKESYEMMNKLCLRVLSFPRPRTPGVVYKGRFRCHHNTMPKKGAKPNAKHTACSAVLSVTLLDPQESLDEDLCPSRMKALVFLKNTHNHALGDAASLRYRKPIHEVKEKFLKLFEAKKTVPQALAIHKADLEKEYGAERLQSVINDRAFMPDARWAYGLYYSCYKKKRDEPTHQDDSLSPDIPSPSPVTSQQSVPPPQDPYRMMTDMFKSVCETIAERCERSPGYFYSALQSFVANYESSCHTDVQLLSALQSFGKFYSSPSPAPCRPRTFQHKNVVGLQNTDFAATDGTSVNVTTTFHPFAKYNGMAMNPKPLIAQRTSVVQSTNLLNEREVLTAVAANPTMAINETHNGLETRTFFTVETAKYDDRILYPIENRQNVTSNCWLPTNYEMF